MIVLHVLHYTHAEKVFRVQSNKNYGLSLPSPYAVACGGCAFIQPLLDAHFKIMTCLGQIFFYKLIYGKKIKPRDGGTKKNK